MVGLFSKVYTNLILISIGVLLLVVVGIPWSFKTAELDPLHHYLTQGLLSILTIMLASTFVSTPLLFAKRAQLQNRRAILLDVNAIAMYIAAGITLIAWWRAANQSYLGPTPDALADMGQIDKEIRVGMQLFTLLAMPIGMMLSLITTFAARESDVAAEEEDVTIRERNFIEKKEAEYLSRGFEVEQNGSLKFLPGYRADLIVRKDGETKVIEVRSRTSLARSPNRKKLAKILHRKPGWSYDLLLVGEPEKLESPEGAQSFAEEEIRQRMAEAELILERGSGEAAFLLAWSACEAVTRRWLEAEGIAIRRVTKAGYVLDTAVFHGVISRDDYRYLTDMMKYRNAIAHGFDVKDFSDNKVTELLDFIRRLLDSEPEPA